MMGEQDTGSEQAPSHGAEESAQELPLAVSPNAKLNTSEVVGATWGVLSKNFSLFFPVAFAATAPGVLLTYVAASASDGAPSHAAALVLALKVLGYLLMQLGYPLTIAALAPATATHFGAVKERTPVRDTVQAVLRARSAIALWTLGGVALALPDATHFLADPNGDDEYILDFVALIQVIWLPLVYWFLIVIGLQIPGAVLNPTRPRLIFSLPKGYRLTIFHSLWLVLIVLRVGYRVGRHWSANSLVLTGVVDVLHQTLYSMALAALASTLYIKIRSLRDGIDVAEIAQDFR